MRTPWIALLLVSTVLAGCSDDGGETVDPAAECDGIYDAATGACAPHVEPSVVVEDLPDSMGAYSTVAFTWRLDNGTRGMGAAPVHSMDSRIVASTDSARPTNATGPDDWGVEVAREQHQNLPGSFEGSLTWDEVGTVYLQGYMLIEGENVWTDLGSIEVTEAQPTGDTTTVNVTAGPPPAVDVSQAGLVVGDALVFDNQGPVDYTAVFTCSDDVTVPEIAVGANGQSQAFVFTMPTNCDYTLQSTLAQTGQDPLGISGQVNVNRP